MHNNRRTQFQKKGGFSLKSMCHPQLAMQKYRTREIQHIPTWDNKAYKASTRTEPCVICEQTPSDEPHHEIRGGDA